MWSHNRTLYHAAVSITQSWGSSEFNQKAQFVGLIADVDARLLENKSNNFGSLNIKVQDKSLEKTSAVTQNLSGFAYPTKSCTVKAGPECPFLTGRKNTAGIKACLKWQTFLWVLLLGREVCIL